MAATEARTGFESSGRPAKLTLPWLASWIWLSGMVAVLCLAGLLQTGPQRAVILPGIGRLPETCAMHQHFGMDCPGCGLTRCFIHAIRGDIAHAWQLSPVGLGLFCFVAWQVPLAALHVMRVKGRWLQSWSNWNQWAVVALMVALTAQWLWRMYTGELWS